MSSFKGRVCVVTGANSGIGLETARGLLSRGATVILACRDVQKGEAAKADIIATTKKDAALVMPLDLASLASVRTFAAALSAQFKTLDVLVNNAGLWVTQRQQTTDGLELTWGVNHLGPMALTLALVPLLKASPQGRVVTVSSGLHVQGSIRWADVELKQGGFDGGTAYRQSKLANVMFSNALARRLEGSAVTSNALAPGLVATQLFRHMGASGPNPSRMQSALRGASCSLYVATTPSLASVTGRYFERQQEIPCTPTALNIKTQDIP